jgi:hypothetical protein
VVGVFGQRRERSDDVVADELGFLVGVLSAIPLMSSCGGLPSGVAKTRAWSSPKACSTLAISTRKSPVEMPGWPLGWANGSVLPEEMIIRAFGLGGDCGGDGAVDGSGVAMAAPFRLSLTG